MTKEPLTALAERVEGLTGPCRETDFAVWNSTGTRYDTRKYEAHYCPAYTASLDAAMTLVPENLCPGVSENVWHGDWHAWMGKLIDGQPDTVAEAHAATPALALTAAALRSRGGSHAE